MKTEIKTIDIQGKTWFDKVNGNSYFSAQITINFALEGEQTYYVPFQYGYGDSYQYEAIRQLQTAGVLPETTMYTPSSFCRDNGIVLRASKKEKCLKSEVKQWGSN